jgi:hypothetical protein
MSTEQIRLLICKDCKTIESLPDFEGPPEQDHLLNFLVAPHKWPDGNEHIGMLAKSDKSDWDSPRIREEITRRLAVEVGGETGFSAEYYATRDTFREDALSCFAKHHRNPDCNDYHSDHKRLTPGTAAERREAGMGEYHSIVDRYLCDFCPVHSIVQKKSYDKAMKKGQL